MQGERVAGRASCSGGVTFVGWSSAGRWSAGRWSAGVEDLQAERVAGREGCFDLLVSAFVFYCNCYLFLFVKGRLG